MKENYSVAMEIMLSEEKITLLLYKTHRENCETVLIMSREKGGIAAIREKCDDDLEEIFASSCRNLF